MDLTQNPRTPTQEKLLLDLIQRLDRYRTGRLAVHLHLSRLSKAYDHERYASIALESFSRYVSGFEGQLFKLWNGDLFFVSKNTPRPRLEEAIDRLQQLFIQDPLLHEVDEEGHSGFYTFYDLSEDYPALLDTVDDLFMQASRAREEAEESAPFLLEDRTQPIQPSLLSKIEQALANVDVTTMTHRQLVCSIIDDGPPQPLFEEIFVSMDSLAEVIAPHVDLAANVWLFRYLTKTLDERIMRMLIRDGIRTARPFSLNLNISSILTPEFSKFEATITPQLRGRLVIEMNKLDIFADMSGFMFARDYLRDHGFRLCLDGLTHHTLRYYDRAALGFDLMKLFWAPDAVENMLPSMIPEVRNLVKDTGQAHTILCRCDDARAIEVGQDLGIVMFQGREVDRRLEQAKAGRPLRL